MRPRLLRPLLLSIALALVMVPGAVACGSGQESSDGDASPAARGEQLASSNGCTSCHSIDGSDGVGPTFAGLAGSQVELDDGTTVVADDEYLSRSITEPSAQIVDGFNGIMPERSLDPDEVDAIVAYLQSLGTPGG